MVRGLILGLMIVMDVAWSGEKYQKIIVASSPTQQYAETILSHLNDSVGSVDEIRQLEKKYAFHFVSRPSGNYYIVTIEPFGNRDVLNKVYKRVRKEYPDAFINEYVIDTTLLPPPSEPKSHLQPVNPPQTPLKSGSESEPPLHVPAQTPPPVASKPLNPPASATEPLKGDTPPSVSKAETGEAEERSLLPEWGMGVLGWILALAAGILLMIRQRQYRELIRSMRELTMSIERKELFMAKISHELRTPLNAIIGLSHVLSQTGLNRYQNKELDRIRRSGEMAVQIVGDILEFSKISSGVLSVENSVFNLQEMLDNVSDIILEKVHAKNIELIFDIDQRIPQQVVGDSLRLSQIIINLLTNAIKFTDEGSITLTVKKVKVTGHTMVLEWTVTDTGIGIREEKTAEIFKSYVQAEVSTSRVYGGMGLGLSIAKELVELMGGSISVLSEFGKGSSFIFTINVQILDPEDIRNYRLPSSALMMNKHVLVIDPSIKAVNVLRHMLKYFHYTSYVVTSVEEAVKWDNDKYDAIFVDQTLLTEETVAQLKLLKAERNIRLVVMGTMEIVDESFSTIYLEFDYCLSKPVTPKQVYDTIIALFSDGEMTHPKKYSDNKSNLKEHIKQLAGSRILLVEDNLINQRVIRSLLKGSGIEVTSVQNGREALKIIQKESPFDLVLMDINMPEMNGYDATKAIRLLPTFDGLAIIALTGDVSNNDRSKAYDAGMDEVLEKPINIQEFYSILLRFIGPHYGVYVSDLTLEHDSDSGCPI